MLRGKKLLILGGSRISCEIIRKARELGIETGVTDWYDYEKSPAKQMADKWYQISTTDIESICNLISEENYDGVITGFTDSVLPHYSLICEKAGLPCYGTKEQFEILINKNKYKKVCRDFEIPVVSEYAVSDKSSIEHLSDSIFPVLIKPSDSSGARGVFICHNKDELKTAYDKAMSFSEAKEVLIEQFIVGEEVTVFWTFIEGKTYLSGIGNRHINHEQKGVIGLPVGYTFPSIITKTYVDTILPKVERMVDSLGIKNGMMFMQCLLKNNECIVYDIGYRLTGSLEYRLLEEICGYNPLEMLIRFAITGRMVDENFNQQMITPYWNKYGCNLSYLIKPGTIKKVSGIEDLNELPGVIGVVQAHLEGETLPVNTIGTLKQIAIRAFGVADDTQNLMKLMKSMYESIDISSDIDDKLLLSGIEVQDVEGKLHHV